MARRMLMFAALSGMLTVILGAFGAHGLEGRLSELQLSWWHKAADYQAIHSLALLGSGLFALQRPSPPLAWAGGLFALGILLFSGSLYALALSGLRPLGMVTPFGGLAFIAAWACLLLAASRLK